MFIKYLSCIKGEQASLCEADLHLREKYIIGQQMVVWAAWWVGLVWMYRCRGFDARGSGWREAEGVREVSATLP